MIEVDAAVNACQNKDLTKFSSIVPKNVDPNIMIFSWEKNGMVIKQGTLLEIAAYTGSMEIVQYLLDNKAEIDKRDEVLSYFFINSSKKNSFFLEIFFFTNFEIPFSLRFILSLYLINFHYFTYQCLFLTEHLFI